MRRLAALALLAAGCFDFEVPEPPADAGGDGAAADSARGDAGALVLASVLPVSGLTTGKIPLTVRGEGFQDGIVVTVDGVDSKSVVRASATELIAELPPRPGRVGPVYVEVRNPDGGSARAKLFSYVLDSIGFSLPVEYVAAQGYCSAVAVADLDADGALDLAATKVPAMGAGTIGLLFGKGDGTFAKSVDHPAGMKPESIAVGDVDGDGLLDVVAANELGNDVTLLRATGKRAYLPGVAATTGKGPRGIVAGDFDGDGKVDLATADYDNAAGASVSLLYGKGGGAFDPPFTVAAGLGSFAIARADFDGDGIADLATVNSIADSVSVLLAGGKVKPAGVFKAPVTTPTGGAGSIALAVGDLDGDALADVVTADIASDGISALLSVGAGAFHPNPAHAPAGLDPRGIATADFNGDGALDVITVNFNGGSASLFLGKGDGNFQAATNHPLGHTGLTSLAVVDLNGDGRLDLVIAVGAGTGPLLVVLNASL